MTVVYLIALVASLVLLVMQFITGGHGELNGPDVEADSDGDAGDTGAADIQSALDLTVFLSLRFWIFFALAFGSTGAMLTVFKLAPVWLTLVLSVAMGLMSGFFVSLVLKALRKGGAGTPLSTHAAIGQIGKVLLPCAKGQVGKIRIELHGSLVDLAALTEDSEIAIGEPVLVNDMQGGVAYVSKAPKDVTD